jgi:hypothetical protein
MLMPKQTLFYTRHLIAGPDWLCQIVRLRHGAQDQGSLFGHWPGVKVAESC